MLRCCVASCAWKVCDAELLHPSCELLAQVLPEPPTALDSTTLAVKPSTNKAAGRRE